MADKPDYIVTNRARGEMASHTAAEVFVRDFSPVISDEPPSRGGDNRGPSPLEYVLVALCACTNVSAARMAEKIRFQYTDLQSYAEGELDTRGRKGEADVPVHYKSMRLNIRIKTDETDERIARLANLVGRYCPVDSLIRAAIPDYEVTWERME
jgi:uncharacterized OsmC-like protein